MIWADPLLGAHALRAALDSSRLLAACAIVGAHLLAGYGLLAAAPPRPPTQLTRAVVVHFVAQQDEPPARWRPPEVKTVAPPVSIDAPQLPVDPLVESSSAQAISPEPRIAQALEAQNPAWVSAVEYLREPSPHYPPQSRRLREQGVVVLRVLIDERGRACNIDVETSSGYARLDRAAQDAVAAAAFRPYLEDGAPRRALVLIPIEFSLRRGSA
jgi:periplasmic protein TonB